MDSLTQFVLGSAVGVAATGKSRAKYALVGGALATLPDLDILIRYQDDIEQMTQHRGFSHSLIFLVLIAPLISYLLKGFFKELSFPRLSVFVTLVLVTHPLLDALTTYGTQLFWPFVFAGSSVSIGSIFIIDPLYSIWLLLAFFTVLIARRDSLRALAANRWALIISTTYLLGGLLVQQLIISKVGAQYPKHELKVVNAPLGWSNWRVLLRKDDNYLKGCVSIGDMALRHITRGKRNQALMHSEKIGKYAHFSDGWYRLNRERDSLVLSDLRMGFGDWSAFRFKVGEYQNNELHPTPSKRLASNRPAMSKLVLSCQSENNQ